MKTETSMVAGNKLLCVAALLASATMNTAMVQAANEMHFVPDVVAQFNALTERPDPLGFYIGNSPDPNSCKHYQGMVRVESADGTPYFIVTRSGVRPNLPGPDEIVCADIGLEDDQPGNLLIVRMGSRDKNGERLRSNRLQRDRNLTDTPPDTRDTTVRFFTFDGQGRFPNYGHPGGMQVAGNILALALEAPYGGGNPEARFLFIDVSDPEHPEIKSAFDPPTEMGVKSGLVGLTPLANGRYLMLATGGDNSTIWFFESSPTDGSPDSIASLSWMLKDEWRPNSDPEDVAHLGQDWPNDPSHQTLQFLREGGINGTLYVAGARGAFGTPLNPDPEDRIDLYRVDFIGNEIRLKIVASKHQNSHPNADPSILSPGNNTANFAAASTFYVSPSGELIFYATEHENDGPIDPPSVLDGQGSVKAGEWRHIDMVRPNSPTLLPTLVLFPPYEVLEGGDTILTALAKPPIARPWFQLFTHPNYDGRYVVVDFVDWAKDSFDNFKDLDGSLADVHQGFNDEPSSWRWFAPVGGTIRANDHDFGDGGFPGQSTRTLSGTGRPERDANLSSVTNNSGSGSMNDTLTSVEFFADCDDYYSRTPDVRWDLDLNGSFETLGLIATFLADALDGPSEVAVPVMGIHPIDGLVTLDAARVRVLNVAPSIDSFELLDPTGLKVGVEVPFALMGLEYTAQGTFTDPGKPDHQTATLDWGDGIVESSAAFDVFTDAFGGVTGQFKRRHVFGTAGTYPLRVQVQDDDGGQSGSALQVEVLSPLQALGFVLEQIDLLLGASTNSEIIEALLDARDSLDGNNNGAALNGAIDELEKGNLVAVMVKLADVVASLGEAELAGAGDLSALKYLITLIAESVTQTEYLRAVAALPAPSPGQAARLERIRQAIADGHALLVAGDHLGAIDKYKDAVSDAEH